MPRIKAFDETETLSQAMELFWQKGFHATSIQDLVEYLGINRASLYDTFEGKEALFLRAFERYREAHKTVVYESLYSQPNVKDGIRNLFEQALRTRKEGRGCFIVNVTTELLPGNSALQDILRAHQKVIEKMIFDYLKSGEVMGEFPTGKDLRSFANLIFTLYNGIQVISKIESAPSRQLAAVEVVLQLLEN